MRYLKSRMYPAAAAHPGPVADTPEDTGTGEAAGESACTISEEPASSTHASTTTKLDKRTAQVAMAMEATALILLSLGLSSGPFVIFSLLMTPGSAGPPAMHSLAMHFIPSKREIGRMFGALSVVSSIGTSLLGPLLFGNVFALTVGVYAPTVFALSALISIIGQCCLVGIRVGDSEDAGGERGRNRRVKRVKSSSRFAEGE